jgi:hypothetical protein
VGWGGVGEREREKGEEEDVEKVDALLDDV